MSFERTVWTVVGTAFAGMTLVLVALGLEVDRKLGIGAPDAVEPPAVTDVRRDYVAFMNEHRPESWPPLDESVLDRRLDWSRWRSDIARAEAQAEAEAKERERVEAAAAESVDAGTVAGVAGEDSSAVTELPQIELLTQSEVTQAEAPQEPLPGVMLDRFLRTRYGVGIPGQ